MKILQIAGIVFILLSLPGVYGSPSGATKKVTGVPDVSVDRLNATPDLMQSLPAAALPGEGLSYCGPVAVSNSLVWLSHHGFPKLGMLGGADTPSRQGRLARKLGEHMGSVAGTSPGALMSGIYYFVHTLGYQIQSLKYQGWESTPDMFSAGAVLPDPQWIKSGLKESSAAWLMIGWYIYSPTRDEYSPVAQHWVTLVGYGQDKNGKKDPDVIIIHDPAPRSGATLSHDYVRLERITHGKFAPGSGRDNLNASGWYKMTGDLKIKEGAGCGILDGAVILQLKKTPGR